jgi:hypothetical protein
MATTYPGDPTATEPPSVPPTPGVVPTVVVPADGEPLNVASISQALKALADFEAWLMTPRAQAGGGGIDVKYQEAVQIWRSARLHRRFGVDHLGFPGGWIQRWEQNWEAVALGQLGAGTSSVTQSGWSSSVTKAGAGAGNVSVIGPATVWPASGHLRLEAANTAGDRTRVSRVPPCLFHADVALVMEWAVRIPALQNYAYGMGFNTETAFASGGHGPIAQFYNLAGSGTWRCHTDDGTTLNDADSGVSISTTKTRFRIEYHGANVDDAATERVLFFIDGVLVANMTANMPSVPASPFPYASPLFIVYSTGGTAGEIELGPVRGANNLEVDAF